MKRFHVHLGVEDLAQSIRFYSGLFGAPPTVQKSDYAKWMVDEPRLNFAISARRGRVGVNHLGLQAESADELAQIRDRFAAADSTAIEDEPGANCCYVRSDKHWVTDPQGIAWEGYHTLGEIRYFDGDATEAPAACCGPGTDAPATRGDAAQPSRPPAARRLERSRQRVSTPRPRRRAAARLQRHRRPAPHRRRVRPNAAAE